MLHFDCDYMRGAHPLIMKALTETNMEQTAGYGCDPYCESAREKIRKACGTPEAEVHFLVGGTQTNATVIRSLLRLYEGVIAADTGHVNIHEAGAIEAGGHKVLALPQENGKITAEQVNAYMQKFLADPNGAHMVHPGMVYISHPTEYGTLYTADELRAISAVCRKYGLPLFLDGARLGYGLAAEHTDVTLPLIASLTDVFYIGGTKVGAMFGEAVVFPKPGLVKDFFTVTKLMGGLLAKGRLLGIQFDVLFTDGLYLKIAGNAIRMAMKLKAGFLEKGYSLLLDSPTNQQFVILSNEEMKRISEYATFEVWEPVDAAHTAVRFATDWATSEEEVDELLKRL